MGEMKKIKNLMINGELVIEWKKEKSISALAMVISYTTWKSVGWAIFHGLLSWVFYIVFDFMMAVIMFLFGMWFYKSEGKAAKFLSGYNMKSADERKKYDENAMCKAYGKRMMFMSVPFIIGIIIDALETKIEIGI